MPSRHGCADLQCGTRFRGPCRITRKELHRLSELQGIPLASTDGKPYTRIRRMDELCDGLLHKTHRTNSFGDHRGTQTHSLGGNLGGNHSTQTSGTQTDPGDHRGTQTHSFGDDRAMQTNAGSADSIPVIIPLPPTVTTGGMGAALIGDAGGRQNVNVEVAHQNSVVNKLHRQLSAIAAEKEGVNKALTRISFRILQLATHENNMAITTDSQQMFDEDQMHAYLDTVARNARATRQTRRRLQMDRLAHQKKVEQLQEAFQQLQTNIARLEAGKEHRNRNMEASQKRVRQLEQAIEGRDRQLIDAARRQNRAEKEARELRNEMLQHVLLQKNVVDRFVARRETAAQGRAFVEQAEVDGLHDQIAQLRYDMQAGAENGKLQLAMLKARLEEQRRQHNRDKEIFRLTQQAASNLKDSNRAEF